MSLRRLPTAALISELARIEEQVRRTPSHIRQVDGTTLLNPLIGELTMQELKINRVLRLRRDRSRHLRLVTELRAARVR